MPQLSRVAVISGDSKKKKVPIIGMTASPAIDGVTNVDFRVLNGVLSIPGGTYNVTPNTTFTANVLVWGAGGGPTPSFSGGAGGFATGTLTFIVAFHIILLLAQLDLVHLMVAVAQDLQLNILQMQMC